MKTILNQMKHRSAVVFTGHLDKSDLTKVMGTAEALTFVSYFEGFGIPIVEAMKCACPVLVGNRTSSPEIAGEAALMCDPFDVESIQQNLTLLASDADLKNELRRKGLKRVQQFTWDNTAASVWNILEITLQNAPHGTLDN
jgi:glycosyltransferase involved in cell wall biosynthesis